MDGPERGDHGPLTDLADGRRTHTIGLGLSGTGGRHFCSPGLSESRVEGFVGDNVCHSVLARRAVPAERDIAAGVDSPIRRCG